MRRSMRNQPGMWQARHRVELRDQRLYLSLFAPVKVEVTYRHF